MTFLEFHRRRLGFTQERLAKAAGRPLCQDTISKLETGRYNPRDSELAKLSRALGGVPPHILMCEVVPLEPTTAEVHA